MKIGNFTRTYAPKNTQRFKFGFEFSIFWVFEFWVWVWVFCKSLTNLEKHNLKWKKKLFFGYRFEKLEKNLNWYSNPYSKIIFFFFHFKLCFSKFVKDLQNTQTQTQNSNTKNSNTQKIENSNPNLNLWVFLGAYVWFHNKFTTITIIIKFEASWINIIKKKISLIYFMFFFQVLTCKVKMIWLPFSNASIDRKVINLIRDLLLYKNTKIRGFIIFFWLRSDWLFPYSASASSVLVENL